jgi:hypothetical protein
MSKAKDFLQKKLINETLEDPKVVKARIAKLNKSIESNFKKVMDDTYTLINELSGLAWIYRSNNDRTTEELINNAKNSLVGNFHHVLNRDGRNYFDQYKNLIEKI